MSDSDENPDAPKPQSPSQSSNLGVTSEGGATNIPEKATVEQAKTFLKDGVVRSESRERKMAFLIGKGLQESEVIEILDQLDTEQDDADDEQKTANKHGVQSTSSVSDDDSSNRPPIITYPEFLTQPIKPPPLVTMSAFLNTCVAFGGLSSLIYATSQLVLQPMVESLTDARIDLHSTAKTNITQLVEKLEAAVSEIPAYGSTVASTKLNLETNEDDEQSDSTYDDPTELFHRDVGVQTSAPPSPSAGATSGIPETVAAPDASAPASHAKIVSDLVSSLREIREGCDMDVDEYVDIRASLNTLRDEVRKVSTQAKKGYNQYSFYSGSAGIAEPDDEIKQAKENIRRVKGVLLASRSFPARGA